MKSHATTLHLVYTNIYKDVMCKCSTDRIDVDRDLITIKSRTKDEGVSFLTLTLPNFCQSFERSLELGKVTPDAFSGWKKRLCLPAFMQGFMRNIFSIDTGDILSNPCVNSIEAIRQICLCSKKIKMECSTNKIEHSFNKFKENEQFLSDAKSPDTLLFDKVCELLWTKVFNDFNHLDLIPKHGPGSTQEKILGNKKFSIKTWHERLESYFPFDHHAVCNVNHMLDDGYLDRVDFLEIGQEPPVRVVAVPKTLKGPRIIAIEPVCMQYTQQALSTYLIDKLESDPITSGHINFHDQKVNQRLALRTSVDKTLACFDLSDASDRVPLSLVCNMCKGIPEIMEALYACRSRSAKLPSGEIIHLEKFASMGSALCFPIEAMYFFSVILTALFEKHNLPVTYANIKLLSRNVYVYGDDIFVPIDAVDVVVETLTRFMCKVNVHKSFWKSNFRESCGLDAYNGYNVTPTYIRNMPPDNKKSVDQILSTISTSNQFHLKGYWHTANYLKLTVEAVIGKLPVVGENSDALGWYSFNGIPENNTPKSRWNKDLQKVEYFTYVNRSVYKKDELDSWPALLKVLLQLENRNNVIPDIDKDHLKRTSRSGTSSIKRRWTTVY